MKLSPEETNFATFWESAEPFGDKALLLSQYTTRSCREEALYRLGRMTWLDGCADGYRAGREAGLVEALRTVTGEMQRDELAAMEGGQ